jgi:hypothetical protein
MSRDEMQEVAVGLFMGIAIFILGAIALWNTFLLNFNPTADLSWLGF